MYCALIGDIIDSRGLDQRWATQEKLKKILEDLNNKYAQDVAAGFTITLGDEFQGLLSTTRHLMAVIDAIRMGMHPVKIRFGVGIGPMSTEINQGAALGADGPAYHAARDGLTSVKDMNSKYVQGYTDTRCYYYSHDDRRNLSIEIVNATLSAIGFIADKWTDKQRVIIVELEKGDLSQREIGKKLNITQSSVQRRLDSAGYYTYKNGRKVSNEHLTTLWEALNDQ